MIEPYDLNNMNFNISAGNLVEKTFLFLVIFITIWIYLSLIIWLIRKPFKIRKSNKIWR